jgi:hypothetical protein
MEIWIGLAPISGDPWPPVAGAAGGGRENQRIGNGEVESPFDLEIASLVL